MEKNWETMLKRVGLQKRLVSKYSHFKNLKNVENLSSKLKKEID